MASFVGKFFKKFKDEQRGSLSIEAVFAFPMLVWAATATYTFFDAYKAQNASYRANYTISDMLSRQTDSIDMNYLNGLQSVFDYMTRANPADSWIRVSVIHCLSDCDDEANRVMEFEWSRGANGARDLVAGDMSHYDPLTPMLSDSERLILVETSMTYSPPFRKFLTSFRERDLVSHVLTRPRFAPQLLWDSTYDGTGGGGHEDHPELLDPDT